MWQAKALAVAGLAAWSLARVTDAEALVACTVAEISAQDPGCPSGSGPCSITKFFSDADGCVLDFGARAVTVSAAGEIDFLQLAGGGDGRNEEAGRAAAGEEQQGDRAEQSIHHGLEC